MQQVPHTVWHAPFVQEVRATGIHGAQGCSWRHEAVWHAVAPHLRNSVVAELRGNGSTSGGGPHILCQKAFNVCPECTERPPGILGGVPVFTPGKLKHICSMHSAPGCAFS